MRVNRIWAGLLILVSLNALGAISIKGGRYYISIDNVMQEKWYGARHTANAAAINMAFDCVCTVVIKQPDMTISIIEDQAVEEPVITSSATLSWSPPTHREGGVLLSIDEISHYLVANQFNDVTTVTRVNYGATSSFEFADLAAGIHYYKIAAVDVDGLISDYSETVSKTIQ